MIKYQEELLENLLEEIKPLLLQHWQELANHKDVRPLNPDFDLYIKMNRSGMLKGFTVRDDGKLIGYASFAIMPNMHYKDWMYATCDIYYLDPSYRNTGEGLAMFEAIEAWLKGLGIKSLVMHEKVTHPHTRLFDAMGFTLIERHYEKVL